jgi:hypothetical protein
MSAKRTNRRMTGVPVANVDVTLGHRPDVEVWGHTGLGNGPGRRSVTIYGYSYRGATIPVVDVEVLKGLRADLDEAITWLEGGDE